MSPSTTAAPNHTAPVPIRDAVLAWIAGWFGGSLLSTVVFQASGADSLANTPAGWILAAQVALWVPMVAATWYVGSRHGSGDLRRDYAVRFRAVDLVGIPLGVAVQLAVLPLVYWPLGHAWPDTFGRSRLEKPARELWNAGHGVGVVFIVLVVVVGAPLVEELVYRGLLHGAFTRCTGRVVGTLLVAVWFAAIHFQPVQFPGLLVVGLVLGVATLQTGRLGLPILTHLAFNATGLAMVAWVHA